MNYLRAYQNLIQRAYSRILEENVYSELHHIVPRCMGGSDERTNLVRLLPEEHYIAHLLLIKIYPDNEKLMYAANMMANRNNKRYSFFRKRFANMLKGRKHSEESKKKMSESRVGVPKSESHKESIRKKKYKELEYNGVYYEGYESLFEETGVSYHLYNKYYKKGINPEPYIGNNTHGMVENVKKNPPKAALGKKWFNDGVVERYLTECPEGWSKGRLRK